MTQEKLNRKTIIEQATDKRITQREGENKSGIRISKESMRQIMIKKGKHHSKKKSKKRSRPPRECRCHRGELIQIDGSYHACLLLFVDDATSAAVAATFVDRENYFAYAAL